MVMVYWCFTHGQFMGYELAVSLCLGGQSPLTVTPGSQLNLFRFRGSGYQPPSISRSTSGGAA